MRMTIHTHVLPYLPIRRVFDFFPLPPPVLAAILLITGLHLMVSEYIKHVFSRQFG
jgi:hypothetical protein